MYGFCCYSYVLLLCIYDYMKMINTRYLQFNVFIRYRIFGSNEEAGAQPSIFCAIDESVTQHSGRYFDNCMLGRTSKLAEDDGLAKKLWEVSCQATGVDF